MTPRIALIGPGRVGCAVAKHLYGAGFDFSAIVSRERHRAVSAAAYIGCSRLTAAEDPLAAAQADIVLLGVPDDQVRDTAVQYQQLVDCHDNKILIHFSGLLTAETMRYRSSQAKLLSLHPLFPFASRQQAYENLTHCPCALEGDSEAITVGRELLTAFAGQAFLVPSEKKPLYHAAASMASNYLVTLLACARDLMADCGIEAGKALELLLPLVQASVDNVKQLSPEQGLTGPIVRGDAGTVAAHLAGLKNSEEPLYAIYLELGRKTLELAIQSGRLDTDRARALETLLKPGKQTG